MNSKRRNFVNCFYLTLLYSPPTLLAPVSSITRPWIGLHGWADDPQPVTSDPPGHRDALECPIASISSSSPHRHPPLVATGSGNPVDPNNRCLFPTMTPTLRGSGFANTVRVPATASPSFAALTDLPPVNTSSLSLRPEYYSLDYFRRRQPAIHSFRDAVYLLPLPPSSARHFSHPSFVLSFSSQSTSSMLCCHTPTDVYVLLLCAAHGVITVSIDCYVGNDHISLRSDGKAFPI